EVPGVVLIVGHLAAVAVPLAGRRPPAGCVEVGDDTMHAVGGEEAVLNALPKAVSIQWVAEVGVGVTILLAEGRGSHAHLQCRLEVFEDLPPVAGVAGTA